MNSKYFDTAAKMDRALIECLEKKDLEYITVKEICAKAGVNRSTFYLHYDTIADLLNECADWARKKCFEKYSLELTDVKKRLTSENAEQVILISPEYLMPFLEFVQENKRLFKVVLSHPMTFDSENTFLRLFDEIFSPAMDKFHIENRQKQYVVRFYLGGIITVVNEWIKKDCAESTDFIADICLSCIMPSIKENDLMNADSNKK